MAQCLDILAADAAGNHAAADAAFQALQAALAAKRSKVNDDRPATIDDDDDEMADAMRAGIIEAQASLAMALDLIDGTAGSCRSLLAARSVMNEAMQWLEPA